MRAALLTSARRARSCNRPLAARQKPGTARRHLPCAKSPPGFRLNLHVPSKVTAETLYIMQPDNEEQTKLVKQPVDLQGYMAAGLLVPCDFQEQAEVELFVQMAAQLGDGEAACFAIAKQRGWALATDDRRARRLAAESSLAVVTTPELVKLWAGNTKASDEEIVAVLQNIQRFAIFHASGKRSRVCVVDEFPGASPQLACPSPLTPTRRRTGSCTRRAATAL